jgi:hypothetical protein
VFFPFFAIPSFSSQRYEIPDNRYQW